MIVLLLGLSFDSHTNALRHYYALYSAYLGIQRLPWSPQYTSTSCSRSGMYDKTLACFTRKTFIFSYAFLMQVYQEFLKQLRPLLVSRENNVMLEFSFWQTSPPMVTDGIYELRKYSLKVTKLTKSKSPYLISHAFTSFVIHLSIHRHYT